MSRLMSQPAASRASAATAEYEQTPAANSHSTVHTRRANGLPPKIIEVEPVVRGKTTVIFETFGVAPHDLFNYWIAIPAIALFRLRQPLDMNLVPVAAPVKAEYQCNRPIQHGGNAHRPGRETSLLAEKLAGHRASAPEGPVRQHPDDVAARQGGLDFQYGIHLAQGDDLHPQVRIDGFEHRPHFSRV